MKIKNEELTDMILLQGDTIQVIIGQVEKLELDLKDLKGRLLNLEKQSKKEKKCVKLYLICLTLILKRHLKRK